MFNDTILLKIKRQYSKDESFALVLKKLSEVQLENGKLKSELSELQDKIKVMRNSYTQEGMRTRKVWLKDDLFADIRIELEKLKTQNTLLHNQASEWRDKYFLLLNKK